MNNKDLIQVLSDEGNWFRYSKIIAREAGPLAAIALGNLIDKSNYFDTDYFFHTRSHIEFETNLSDHQQRKAEKKLEELGLIEVHADSHPTQLRRVNYYQIFFDQISEFLVENKKNLADKKREHDEFLAICRTEVQSLNNSTPGGSIIQPPDSEKLNSNKNILIRTYKDTTKGLKEAKASTPANGIRKNTTALDDLSKEVIDAYRKEVDAYYMPEPADVKHLASFKYKEELVKFMPYWIKYNGTHKDYLDRGNNVDYHDKNNTAQLYVIIRHWNNFNKFASKKIESEKQYAQAFGDE